ncbi:Hypothetical protein R9X50_00479000 [Acrodontium crateriforme]|uniref:ubiquitinyl hydrolase 1 n=1 Tax=Acrodontium crateriforme TaxID=150365 RepID=A0AAQ3RAE4_9PEZI|nr:Hypothetical protein R9X50_00479000 [Acrodontium crateriforme]
MDPRAYLEELQLADRFSSTNTAIISGITLLSLAYQILLYFDVALLSPLEILWNALISIIPAPLLLNAEKRRELRANNMLSQMHATKAEALRKMFATNSFIHKLSAETIRRRGSMLSPSPEPTTEAPPGLGNWDNSCYQNSILQGLAALRSLETYLNRPEISEEDGKISTTASLLETVGKLNDAKNNGRQLWTPPKLKSMSSWQQQDAQEYFSKVMDELDKEAAKSLAARKPAPGIELAVDEESTEASDDGKSEIALRNPLEGLLAQRVGCTQCGYSEGLSMIPFNCLTLSLGSDFAYNIGQCLNEYTKLEEISEVDCPKCTLLNAEKQLKKMVPEADEQQQDDSPEVNTKALSLPSGVREMVIKRLHAIQTAIEEEDFSDKTINETCQISKKAHVSSTKTKQAVVGRAPQSLVVHINRSVFDETTFSQRKNYAAVTYPMILGLGPWVMNNARQESDTDAIRMRPSLLSSVENEGGPTYRLQAVVTHYGRHENGHYICYRKHATIQKKDSEDMTEELKKPAERWWRLSDEDVSPVTEQDVLGQTGVFMLFYERIEEHTQLAPGVDMAEIDVVIERTKSEAETFDIVADDEIASATANKCGNGAGPIQVSPFITKTPLAGDGNLLPKQADFGSSIIASNSATEEDLEKDDAIEALPQHETLKSLPKKPTPPFMRTARGRQSSKQNDGGFGNTMRQMATT